MRRELGSGSEGGSGPMLVVDDDDGFRSFLATTLSSAGFAVREAATGENALAFARTDTPALVLLDICLPGISGFEVCRELREQFGDKLPVVFVSGTRIEPLDRSVGLLIGGDDYLVKPVDPNELLARVRGLVARSRRDQTVSGPPELGLTRREFAVLQRLAQGLRQIDIAAELVISPKTVACHVQHILAKFGVHSRAQAVAIAYDHGLLDGQTARRIDPPSSESGSGPRAA
jgi:two-component system nitrate/nitrite response regulator NarL